MGGIFGVASRNDCSLDLFFGVDYHSHLGTRRGGLCIISEEGKFYDPEKAYECKVEDMLGKELCIYDSLETGNEKYEYKPIARRVIIKECIETPEFVYDVTTETGHFMANFFLSHNCRSFLSPWKDENGEYKFWGRLTNAVEPSLNCVNPCQRGVMVA